MLKKVKNAKDFLALERHGQWFSEFKASQRYIKRPWGEGVGVGGGCARKIQNKLKKIKRLDIHQVISFLVLRHDIKDWLKL